MPSDRLTQITNVFLVGLPALQNIVGDGELEGRCSRFSKNPEMLRVLIPQLTHESNSNCGEEIRRDANGTNRRTRIWELPYVSRARSPYPWSNTIVALDAPLSQRQLDVLRWIQAGCPDGHWTDFTYKTTANALQTRRLVLVSKRGTWKATIEPAGVHYLEHGDYPPGHWHSGQTSTMPENRGPVSRTGLVSAQPKRPPKPSPPPRPPDELTPTRRLLKDIIDAGGVLVRDIRGDNLNYRTLVGGLNRRQMAPDGQQVIMIERVKPFHIKLQLSAVSEWRTQSPVDIVSAERNPRWHPLVSALRKENRLSSIDLALRERAFRLLHRLPVRRKRAAIQCGSRNGLPAGTTPSPAVWLAASSSPLNRSAARSPSRRCRTRCLTPRRRAHTPSSQGATSPAPGSALAALFHRTASSSRWTRQSLFVESYVVGYEDTRAGIAAPGCPDHIRTLGSHGRGTNGGGAARRD